MSLTFGSYLHKMFSPDYFSCREKSCGHDAVRSIVRYFGKRNNVICIKYNKIRVYEAIQPSKPVADDRAVRLYHDVLCKSLEQEAQRTFSAFDKFCIAKIELCNMKNVSFEPMSDDGGNPVLWEDIRARLLELKDEINSALAAKKAALADAALDERLRGRGAELTLTLAALIAAAAFRLPSWLPMNAPSWQNTSSVFICAVKRLLCPFLP